MATRFLYYLAIVVVFPAGRAAAQAPALRSLTAPSPAGSSVSAGGKVVPAGSAPVFNPDSIYVNPQVRPQFTGGDAAFRAYLAKNLRYPSEAMRQSIGGKVYIRFVVSAEGRVTDASTVSGPGHGLNEEALRLVWLMPAWQPGQQDGHPVRVACTIPITFQ
ncbi:energy transducer TonB [Hymenobacter sp. BRD67]|uniref:energy transducer TonB n=1 Tax=Hymenobacter sp. BRD67 TaxID=2675877 RepID=UPI0015639136|nr:energy transducer TonB [Hymenobacter sp. BRD67]QKG51523.1 energy transducer TonB [Hymenobacter sp. BRD67]